MYNPLLLQKCSRNRWDERGEKTEAVFSVFGLSRQLLAGSKKWTFYRTRKKWDFWISGSFNHEEPGSTESITAGIEVVNDPKCRSYTHLVKDELARPPAIGKDTFTLGTAYPQAFLAQEKGADFLLRAGEILAAENFSMKRQPPVSLHLLGKVTYKACRTR